jgi:hypothetical protein
LTLVLEISHRNGFPHRTITVFLDAYAAAHSDSTDH